MVTSDPNPVFLFVVASDRILWSQVTAMPFTCHPARNESLYSQTTQVTQRFQTKRLEVQNEVLIFGP